MVTLSDVARHAGVSTATVSHVLNGTRFVAAETAQRVREALESTGYQVNPFARALRTATTESIGFVASDLSNPYSTAVMKGIEAATRSARHTLLVANSDEDPEMEREAIAALVQRRVDGLVVALTSQSRSETVHELQDLGIPVVLVDAGVEGELDQVLVESRESVRILVEHLIDLGHERIAVLAGSPGNLNSVERTSGWSAALTGRGLQAATELVRHGGIRADTARREFAALLDSPEPPSAVFTSSNQMTLGVWEEINARGLRVPHDIAVIAFDEPSFVNVLSPPLTCIAQPTFSVGLRAVELVFRRIADPGTEQVALRLQPRINHRDSCCDGANALPEAEEWNLTVVEASEAETSTVLAR